jgi:hypothetical protein
MLSFTAVRSCFDGEAPNAGEANLFLGRLCLALPAPSHLYTPLGFLGNFLGVVKGVEGEDWISRVGVEENLKTSRGSSDIKRDIKLVKNSMSFKTTYAMSLNVRWRASLQPPQH